MKSLSKTLLAAYTLLLLWLVLFKSSLDVFSVLANYRSRSLNLIPFASYSWASPSEMISNILLFVPLGILMAVRLTQVSYRRKLAYVFLLSVAMEAAQFVFAIGSTDITDIVLNTLGGFIGLALYKVCNKFVGRKWLDRFFVLAIAGLLLSFLFLRFFVFKIRY